MAGTQRSSGTQEVPGDSLTNPYTDSVSFTLHNLQLEEENKEPLNRVGKRGEKPEEQRREREREKEKGR